jgi:hypothetical protein
MIGAVSASLPTPDLCLALYYASVGRSRPSWQKISWLAGPWSVLTDLRTIAGLSLSSVSLFAAIDVSAAFGIQYPQYSQYHFSISTAKPTTSICTENIEKDFSIPNTALIDV